MKKPSEILDSLLTGPNQPLLFEPAARTPTSIVLTFIQGAPDENVRREEFTGYMRNVLVGTWMPAEDSFFKSFVYLELATNFPSSGYALKLMEHLNALDKRPGEDQRAPLALPVRSLAQYTIRTLVSLYDLAGEITRNQVIRTLDQVVNSSSFSPAVRGYAFAEHVARFPLSEIPRITDPAVDKEARNSMYRHPLLVPLIRGAGFSGYWTDNLEKVVVKLVITEPYDAIRKILA